MKNKKLASLIGLPAVLILVGAVAEWQHQSFTVAYRYLFLLEGQTPSKERLVRTSTGSTPHYDPIQYRAKDARPAITEPEFVAAKEAKISGGTRGIGVSINSDSRFYPLYVLQYHQIVNDTCGGKAVACSY